MTIKQKLIDEFNSKMEELSQMDLGDETYETSVNAVTKLADRIIKIKESEISAQEKEANRSLEENLEKQKIKDERNNKLIGHGITIVTALMTLGVSLYAYKSNMKYETEGIIPTTEGGRTSLRNLFKLKF